MHYLTTNQVELINRWFEKSEKELNPFDKFISLWISFNAFYAHRHLQKKEQDQLKEFRIEYGSIFKDIFNNGKLNDAFIAFQAHIHDKPRNPSFIQDLRFELDTDKERKNRKYYHNLNDLNQFIKCVYQVRCNLFHGGKDLKDGQDEIIVNLAFNSLKTLLTQVYIYEGILSST